MEKNLTEVDLHIINYIFEQFDSSAHYDDYEDLRDHLEAMGVEDAYVIDLESQIYSINERILKLAKG